MGLDGLMLTVEVEDLAPPARWSAESEKKTDGRCLARTIRSEIADHFTPWYLQIEAVERKRIAVTLREALGTYGHFCHCDSPPLSYVHQSS